MNGLRQPDNYEQFVKLFTRSETGLRAYVQLMLPMCDRQWKLMMNLGGSRIELYNIEKDIMEVDNVADQNPEVVAGLSRMLIDWHKQLPKGPIFKNAGDNSYPWP